MIERQVLRVCGKPMQAVCRVLLLTSALGSVATAQHDSVSTWEAADFRSWSFIPYWTSQSQLSTFSGDGVYDHVSDVLYFSGVRPTSTGDLNYHPWAAQHLATLAADQAEHGFRYHMSMFDTYGGSVETVWNSIVSNRRNRNTFVNNVKNLLEANGMTGFNLDWERPNTVTEWANYTQLAKDLKDAIGPLGMEVSVDDYGFADSRWDDSTVFDAAIYDQLFIMGYHYPAYSSNSLNHNSFANGKLALTGQGADKAFKDEQLVLGIGTWGKGTVSGQSLKTLKDIAAADPDLPYNTTNWTDGTNTWTIESRQMVRDKVQLALDRNMAGVMYWTLHYDATNELSLHRVAHHYVVYQREVPDLNLDGRVDGADAHALADNMGSVPGWTGTNTPARFDEFYREGNWEVGDHNGNGFVNQADADWLAGRFAALGLNLPDRLAYTGTFESFQNGTGLADRWRAVRDGGGNLPETGNYAQHAPGTLSFSGSGPGADKHSDSSITIRNQNAAEAFDSLNTAPREIEVDLAAPIHLGQNSETYFTLLVQENTGPLLSSQLASDQRNLFLEFRDAAGTNQFDVSLSGKSGQVGLNHRADAGGEDVSTTGLLSDETYLLVGKVSGSTDGENTLELSYFPEGGSVGNFTHPGFSWMLTAHSSTGFDPVIDHLRFVSLYEANYTVSNLQIGSASVFFDTLSGDYNGDGIVDAADYTVWRDSQGQTGSGLAADGTGPAGLPDGVVDELDYALWHVNFGQVAPPGSGTGAALDSSSAVPEPATGVLLLAGLLAMYVRRRAG